jgi:2-C-methyl-D-erythritol 4-phosphate cytidylyltransferase
MNVAIVVAAGQGRRMGGKELKQFRLLAGLPVIVHTLKHFEDATTIGEVVVVVTPEARAEFVGIAGKHGLRKVNRVVTGGDTRIESVWRGLQTVRPATARIVAVHDGVRPFVTSEEIDTCVRAAEEHKAAILVAPAIDTIKEIADDKSVSRTISRASVRHALTPQCFHYDVLRRAYEKAISENMAATDDSSLVERLGVRVHTIDGDARRRNIKITSPEDWALAEILIKNSE